MSFSTGVIHKETQVVCQSVDQIPIVLFDIFCV